jgi:hypothetical protein
VYNRQGTYDRCNPKIALKRWKFADVNDSLYQMGFQRGELKFRKGYQNQEVTATFGYVEADGTPPPLIKRALKKLVVEKLTNPIYVAPDETAPAPASVTYAGVVVSETTDGHSIYYGTPSFDKRRVGYSGLTQDQEVLTTIDLYRAPLGIANTSQWGW